MVLTIIHHSSFIIIVIIIIITTTTTTITITVQEINQHLHMCCDAVPVVGNLFPSIMKSQLQGHRPMIVSMWIVLLRLTRTPEGQMSGSLSELVCGEHPACFTPIRPMVTMGYSSRPMGCESGPMAPLCRCYSKMKRR